MKKMLLNLWIILSLFLMMSCQIGLGDEVDLEAPEITLSEMISGDTIVDSSHFGAGVYCRKKVTFKGTATDNKAIDKVYAEIKWSDQEDFSYYADATLEGNNFTFNFDLENQGIVYLKFVVTDKNNNYGVKSSKVVTLLVDEDAPVAEAWYIDRQLNGIQYSLKPIEELKAIDFSLPENKDAAQNVSFSIHSAFKDIMGLKPGTISIQIKDENQNTICSIPNSVANDYSPKFEVTHELLSEANSKLSTGMHYLQVWYNAEDIVTIPESNKAQDVQVEGGWFIWWPESDLPKITQKPAEDEVAKSILLNVSEAVTVTVFDDDSIKEAYCALLTESEYALIKDSYKTDPAKLLEVVPDAEKSARTVKSEPSATKRDEVFSFVSPKSPQVMYLAYYVKDSGGKITTADHVVNVTDATSPILYIASPSNNAVPTVEMKNNNSQAIVTVEGQTIDTSGCKYLEFVWVPDTVEKDNAKKSLMAKEFLNSLGSDSAHNEYAPSGKDNVKVTVLPNKLKVWSVKLDEEENAENGYKQQDFKFTMDLLNDFICNGNNEKNNNKFFVVKVTRKDGKNSVQEYKLSADTTKPIIKSISPENTTQIIGSTKNFKLQFYAEKANGLAIDTLKYSITGKLDGAEIPIELLPIGEMEGNYFTTTILADTLKGYETSGKRPIYTFTAEDIFGNVNSTSYTIIISSLPTFNSITSSSPDSCKKGDKITFNANFSDTINDNGSFATNPPKLILQGFSDNKDREAKYVSGVGSPTLVFEYTTQEGDLSNGITIKETDGKGYIDTNGNTALEDGVDVHIYTNVNPTVLEGKTIKVDAVSPKVENYAIETSVSANEEDRKYYLNQGKTITAKVTLSKNVFVQGAPTFKFTNGIELDFVGSSSNLITFSGAVPAGFNGDLEYKPSECITESDKITDTSGNVLLSSATTSNQQTDIIIDTTVPNAPAVKSADNTELTNNGNYQESVKFKIISNDADVINYEYSLDAGTSWKVAKNDGTDTVSLSYAELTARVTDKAGNVSLYPTPIKLNIESSFPAFSVDCLTPNGNYKKGDEIKFRIYFEKEVNLLNRNAKITVGTDKYATVTTASANKLKQIDFSYTVKDGDSFDISVDETSVSLGEAVVDLFGFMQGNFKPTSVPSSIDIHCDAVAPTVTSAIPNDGTAESQNFTADTNNIYTTGNQIKITFSEPVQKGSGNIILRQTAGWAIPPVLTAEEFNTICAQLGYDDKNKLARQDVSGKLEEDMEDTSVGIKHRNNEYHGTGQYIGPYKKSMQGIKLEKEKINENGIEREIEKYVPDIDTKFVLDFDIGIWETTETHPIGKTFENHAYKAPTSTTSAGEIRGALEEAGLHQRVLDVTSANVKVNGNEVTITFPKGLIDQTDALPDGREWELVFEKGTFLDITGNEFGAGLTKDAIQENGTQTEVSNTWKRGRTSITDKSKPLVLIKTNGNEYFNSDKVATPVVRVDRYSYGLGIRQANADGTLTAPIANDGVKPTGYVRVRIDCETKDATVVYSETKQSKNNGNTPSNTTYENDGTNWKNGNKDLAKSYCTTTNLASYAEFTTTYVKTFAVGSGNYNESYKGIVAAKGTKDKFTASNVGIEGVFQTVVYMKEPTWDNCDKNSADAGTDKTDVSIRGTTGFAGEPYISPFPLRDSRVGSPYLRIIFRESTQQGKTNSKDYYWISYEVLVESSFSNYSWHNAGYYDWACNWGLMQPGEFTRVEQMTNWG